jgi:hypothetical protein
VLSLGAVRITDRSALRLIVVVIIVFHLATAALEIAYLSFASPSLVLAANIAIRLIAAAIFLVAWKATIRETRMSGNPERTPPAQFLRPRPARTRVQPTWLSDVVITGMPRTPNSLEWIESLLESLSDSPLNKNERLSAALLLQGIVRNYAAMIQSIPAGTDANTSFVSLLPVLSAGAYPRLIAELQRARDSVSDEFAFALDTAIRGLAFPHS